MNASLAHVDVKKARFERILRSMGADYLCTASQVSDYELCPRKWYFKYVEGIETPPKKSTDFGTAVHEHLEDWLKHGVVPPDTREGRCAHEILMHLPHPHDVQHDEIEPEIEHRLGGVLFTVQMDLFRRRLDPPHVYDHKTTGDEMWAKSSDVEHPNGLLKDPQFTLYSAIALLETNASLVRGQWTYGLSKGKPRAWPVKLDVCGRDLRPRLDKTIQSAREMRMLKSSGLRALDVVYDAGGCEQYGGCPFQDRCNLTAQERMDSIMSDGEQRNLFLQQVAQKQGMAAPSNGAPAPTQAPLINPLLAATGQAQPGIVQTTGTAPPELPKKKGRSPATPGVQVPAPPTLGAPAQAAPSLPPELVKAVVDACQMQVFVGSATPGARWSLFAATATQAVVQTLGMNALQNAAAAADIAATVADALQAEHAKRFPNT
jgi:hypothetical protein